ncbi:MAG TPA: DegV family protein [Symbiobacteriaceae bacterium]|nr:DegV family protein [Symbiobacteriaceae bacterium]
MAANPVKVLCDSCADLPLPTLRQYNIHSIPLTVSFGNESFKDGVDITAEGFYQRLRTAASMPTTSQVTPAEYMQFFGPLTADGADLVYVSLSSGLSGSYQSAVAAASAEPFRDRVHVVDSLGASIGLGLMVLQAAELAAEGRSAAEIVNDITAYRGRMCHVFTLDTLEYARRGGRVSAFSAIAANVLDVKPVLHMDMAGKLIPIDRVRGRKRSINRLFEEMERLGANVMDKRVGISHAQCEEEAAEAAHRFRTKYSAREVVVGQIGATIGAHVGPGCLSIFFEGPDGRGA